MTTTPLEPRVSTPRADARPTPASQPPARELSGRWPQWAPVPLRLILGFGFLYHGAPKIFTAAGHEQFTGMLSGIGVPLPNLMAWVVGLVETVGGLCFLLGAFVALFATLNIISMLVAMVAVHLPNGFNFMNVTGMTDAGPEFGMPGYEVNLLYIAALAALLLGGAGAASLDDRVRRAVASRS
jgi:putative oxidoreductase